MAGRGRITTTPPIVLAMATVAAVTVLPESATRLRPHRLALVGSLAGLAVLVCIVLVDGRRSSVLASVVTYAITFTAFCSPRTASPTRAAVRVGPSCCWSSGSSSGSLRCAACFGWQTAAAARGTAGPTQNSQWSTHSYRPGERVRQHAAVGRGALPYRILQGIADGTLDPPTNRCASAPPTQRPPQSRSFSATRTGPLSERLADLIVEQADSVHPGPQRRPGHPRHIHTVRRVHGGLPPVVQPAARWRSGANLFHGHRRRGDDPADGSDPRSDGSAGRLAPT